MAKPKQPTPRQSADRLPQTPPVKTPSGKAPSGKAPAAKASPAQASPPKAPPVQASTAKAVATAPAPERPPGTVRAAVMLMYAGAVLSAVDVVVTLTTVGKLKSLLHAARPNYSPSRLSATVHAEVAYFVITWLITIAFWIVMARTNRAGRAWARIFSTGLCVVSTLSFIGLISQPNALISKVILAPMWLAGVAAIVLLWRAETTAYIRAMNPERAARADSRRRRPAVARGRRVP
jgi:hypothetical protein